MGMKLCSNLAAIGVESCDPALEPNRRGPQPRSASVQKLADVTATLVPCATNPPTATLAAPIRVGKGRTEPVEMCNILP